MHKDIELLKISGEAADQNGVVEVVGLWGSSKTMLAAQVAEELGASVIYVAPGRLEAEAAHEDFLSYATDPADCVLLPAWEVLPTDAMAPSDDIVAERMTALNALSRAKAEGRTVFATVSTRAFLQRVVNREHLLEGSITLGVGEEHDLEDLAQRLVGLGYERELMVEERGHMSIRGGIFDVFPISAELPYRIEFFGDEIESIRVFEPETQRSMESVDTAHILPRSEKELLFEESEGQAELSVVTDYLPDKFVLVVDEPLTVRDQAERLAARFPDSPYMVDWETATSHAKPALHLELAQVAFTPAEDAVRLNAKTRSISGWAGRLEEFWSQLEQWELAGYAVRVFCANQGEQHRLQEFFEQHGHRPGESAFDLTLHLGRLRGGFVSDADQVAVISEREIFGRKYVRRVRRRFQAGTALTTFSDLKAGDFLVHEIHGVARYHGMRRFDGRAGDFLTLQYARGDMIYLPVTHIDQVQKFVAGGGAVPKVDKIGGASWSKTKKKVKESVRIMTERLLKLYARRESQPGHAFSQDTPFQIAFEDEFPYEETADQRTAIEEVKRDMESERPMDRLLCGDVGFGKTEVAMRAAFKAVMDHKQVAMLVPTTVLAEQHYITFTERFAGFPVKIEMLSRFRTQKENRETVMRARAGEVDIVIGTHRIASKDVGFHDLGLAIIDEEQRFGVKHKERLKELKANVDVLTLTATPIPRTLHLSMSGVRDMSVINTAPNDRLPIHTHIATYDEQLIGEAIEREVGRQGQTFYLHNRVATIEKVAESVKRLVPEARVAIAHGQMPERELENVMTRFVARDFDVLVCTTIIASGLDIPNANTIIVDRSDMFGLAELYQIRGRVGRYKHRAFAYLLIPGDRALTEEAQKRLGALEEFSTLGSGFRIAMRDLEIRGAGNFLGAEQSGHISTVGFETYRELVEETVAELKGQPVKRHTLPAFDVSADASIPDAYIPLESQKITLYRRIAALRNAADLEEMRAELGDRFGRPPKPVQRLLEIMRVRIAAMDVDVRKIAASADKLVIEFEDGLPVDRSARAALKDAFGHRLQFAKRERFSIEYALDNGDPIAAASELIEKLIETSGAVEEAVRMDAS